MSWWIIGAYFAVAFVFGLWIMVALPILAAGLIIAWALTESWLSDGS
jgi:hypothetical protein